MQENFIFISSKFPPDPTQRVHHEGFGRSQTHIGTNGCIYTSLTHTTLSTSIWSKNNENTKAIMRTWSQPERGGKMLNATSLNYPTTIETTRGASKFWEKLKEVLPVKHWRRLVRSGTSERRSTTALGHLRGMQRCERRAQSPERRAAICERGFT